MAFGIKKDCVFYSDESCTALNDLYCKSEKCKFYKNRVAEIKKQTKKRPSGK